MKDDKPWTFSLDGPAVTEAFGARLAGALPRNGGFAIALDGSLGAGKSTLARACLRALGVTDPVPSPTYTLVEPYTTRRGPAYHMDFYRLETGADVQELGVEDISAEEALVLVEWPERGDEAGVSYDLEISLAHRERGRQASVHALSAAGCETLGQLRGGL